MSERIYEEVAVILKQKYTMRFLEYKESGNEFTEINVYNNDVKEEGNEISDYFEFGFTVKGKGDEEKEKIEKMNEKQFDEFIDHMKIFIEKKYNVVHTKEVTNPAPAKEEEKESEEETE